MSTKKMSRFFSHWILLATVMALVWTAAAGAQELPADSMDAGDLMAVREWVSFSPDSAARPFQANSHEIKAGADTLISTAPFNVDSSQVVTSAKRANPWRPLGEIMVANGLINIYARCFVSDPFAKTTLKSIRDNFKMNFVWDDDNFYINNLGHPLQGTLYYNAARSNGLNLWQSIPYTLFGSLTWEYLGETEQPSINDIATTTISGTFLGEASHRLSQQFIDESKRGTNRFLREAATILINPMLGIKRILTGKAWKVRKDFTYDNVLDEAQDKVEDKYSFTVGDRYLFSSGDFAHGKHQPYLDLSIEYGEAADAESHTSLYDFFTVDAEFAYGYHQHLLPRLNLVGRLCSKPVFAGKKGLGEAGLYQFFHYEDTRLPCDSTYSPFPFGEMVSLGPGFMFIFPSVAPGMKIEQRLFAKGVLLGAVNSDYYKYFYRTYNMGSGYGAASFSKITWEKLGHIQLNAYYMHLFTWKGYEPGSISDMASDSHYLNVLGDLSNARVLSFNVQLFAKISEKTGISIGSSFYSRHTHYKYHKNQRAEGYEMKAGLVWLF